MPKTIINDVSHITFEKTVQKLYKQDICGAILDFAFCAYPAKYLQGCPPRLCSWVYVEMISTGQPFTTLLDPWVIITL